MGTEYNAYTQTITTDSASFDGATGRTTSGSGSAEFNAFTGFEVAGDVMSTAKSPSGSPVVGREVLPTDTISTHGHRMTVAMALQMGFLTKDPGGMFTPPANGTAMSNGAKPPTGGMELASGGTAEEALEGGFMAAPETEEALSWIISQTSPDTQIAALDSIMRTGEVDTRILERMASQAGVEPHTMADMINSAHDGMQTAVMQRLAPFGVYDPDAFTDCIHSDPRTHQRMIESVRDLMMNNSTKGMENLAEEFAMVADTVDPASVHEALRDAGIKFSRMSEGGVLLDLTAQGLGQMPFRQAVRLGYIKLSPNI